MREFFDSQIHKIFNLIDNVLDQLKRSDKHSAEEVVSKPSNEHVPSSLPNEPLLTL